MKYILLHGLGQTSASWNHTKDVIWQKADIICPNITGLLKGREVSYTGLYHAFSEYCAGFPEPLHLCGLSLGGILALEYTVKNPARVESLVLIGTQYRMPKGLLRFQNIVFRFMPAAMFRETGLKKNDFIKLTKTMMSLDFRQELKKITCPVLIICGEKDAANKKASRNLARLIPGARLTFIKNAKHEVNVDVPKELGQVLNTFFFPQK